MINFPATSFRFFLPGMCATLFLVSSLHLSAQNRLTPESPERPSSAESVMMSPTDAGNLLIPQYLLPLIHTNETREELELKSHEVESLENKLLVIDQKWWPLRILPVPEQRKEIAMLEQELIDFISTEFQPKVLARLRQLELQAQGPRSLLRAEMKSLLGISDDQIKKLSELAKKTEVKSLELLKLQSSSQPTDEVGAEVAKLRKEETQYVAKLAESIESAKIEKLYGKSFDTARLVRIYPLAPELIDSGEWSGSAKKIRELKGKVILVHFYAFECSNCRANFQRYNEWVDQFAGQNVEVIGIQTPETQNEFDPKKVRSAAARDGLKFPVLIDTKSENWKAWGNTMWPTVYVIDQKGYIRFWWQGELNWKGATGDQKIAEIVKGLLVEKSESKR